MKNLEVTNFTPFGGINISHRKENKFHKQYTLMCIRGGEISEIVIVRTYWTDSRAYVCAWLPKFSASGSGFAGGGGYDKESAAAETALGKCGFNFNQNWGGALSVYDALHAIARHLKLEANYVLTAHA